MSHAATSSRRSRTLGLDTLSDLPILYEDEEEGDMGESNRHVDSDDIIHVCLRAHLTDRPEYRVYANMNLYYRKGPPHPKTGSLPYVSPDGMIVRPFELDDVDDVPSYTVGVDGPAPDLTAEILSARSAQQRDLKEKMIVYAKLRVPEYLLVDASGKYLPQRLLLKRLLPDGTYQDTRDPDGGVTSTLGFRLIIDSDGRPRVLDAATGKRYIRPDEAQREADALNQEIHALKAELKRVRGARETELSSKKKNGRRKKQ
jgi:Uma2 family endonuclease